MALEISTLYLAKTRKAVKLGRSNNVTRISRVLHFKRILAFGEGQP